MSAPREDGSPSPASGGAGPAGTLRSLCLFCGSSPGIEPLFMQQARETGTLLAQRGITLVYGGGHVGLMGAVADAVLAARGRVIGVIPQALMRPEVAHLGLTELHVVDSMHQRKKLMADRSDAFLVLPGGYGTLDEMFEMITWQQLGLQRKPVAAVNTAGYYDGLVRWIHHSVQSGFVQPAQSRLLMVEPTPQAALQRLEDALRKEHLA